MADRALSGRQRPERTKARVALRVLNEKALDKRIMARRAGKMEGVTVLNPGVAMLNRMRVRQVAKAKGDVRAGAKSK